MENFNINTAGFVVVDMFVVTSIAALVVWRHAQIEEKGSARLNQSEGAPTT
jgi:high-affinity nickel permease